MQSRWKWIVAASLIGTSLVLGGCADDPKKKPTQKEAAVAQWNRARAGVLVSLARDQYATGNFDSARKTVDEGLRMDPDNGPLRIVSAKLAIESGQLEQADKDLERARKANPKDPEADYLSGVVNQRWMKPEVALGFYTAASEKDPGELAFILAKAEMLVSMGHQEEALHLMQDKVTFFENSATIRDAVGQLLVQFKKYSEAADMLRQASILATDDQNIREHLALALYFAHRYPEAIETLTRLTAQEGYQKRGDLFLALGKSQIEIGKMRDARASLEKSAQLDDSNAAVWLALGRVAMQGNDLKRAEMSFKRAVALQPENSEARLMSGYLKLKQNKFDEALTAFQRSSALDSSDTVSLCMVGYTLQKLGRADEATRYYAKALKIKPGDEMARKLMASVDMSN
jgi:tetratricopeptide (TPR) repeat protein